MANQPVEVFYFPLSYFSQKVRIVLQEKKILHRKRLVALDEFEQLEPWYLRLNPAGEIPVLGMGGKYVAGSENIVEVIDQLDSSEAPLIPEKSSPEGQSVTHWRNKLDAIEVEEISFGITLNPEMSVSGIEMPAFIRIFSRAGRAGYNQSKEKAIKILERTKVHNPELSDCCDEIIEKQRKRIEARFDEDTAKRLLNDLEEVMDEVEKQLRISRTEHIAEHWLCGARFTLADVHLCILLARLKVMGVLVRYMDVNHRPALTEYWRQACQRPSVKEIALGSIDELVEYKLNKRFKTFVYRGTVAVTAAAVVVALVASRLRA